MSQRIKITTTEGDIIIKLYDQTPQHRDNFIKLVKEGYYNGTLFHRVIKEFMIQGGDPESKGAPAEKQLGSGGPGYTIPAEFIYPQLFHKRGALSAARTGDEINPHRASSGSQFYIVWGKVYKEGELKQMRINRDQAGLMALQEQLINETEKRSAQMGKPTFTKEQVEAYTTLGGTPFLDNQYTVFGEVESGLEVVEKIQNCATNPSDRPKKDISMKMELI